MISRIALICPWLLATILPVAVLRADARNEVVGSVDVSREPGREFLPAALTEGRVEEHAGDLLPLDLILRNDRNEMIRLGSLFADDKPVILSMNYSNCPKLCLLQLNGLINSLREVDLIAGQDYRIVSVSLDPRETFEQSARTKQKYLESYGKAALEEGWHFLSGSESNIKQLASALGIFYSYVPERKEYSHPAVFTICMPDGHISRYHYGIEFPPQTLRLSLVEAADGKIGTPFDRFLLLCFHYDEQAGRYAPTARNLMKLGGGVTIAALGLLFWFCQRRLGHSDPMRRKKPEAAIGSSA